MKHVLMTGGCVLIALTSLSGCVDNNYDLSDIDTTSEFKVKDLVVPINLDPITLGDIFDIKEGDKIQEVTLNGQTFYAINEKGDFKSNPIEIPCFTAQSPAIPSANINFLTGGVSLPAGGSLSLELTDPVERTLVFKCDNIHEAIQRLDEVFTAPMEIKIRFEARDLPSGVNLSLSDVVLKLPKGLDVESSYPEGSYNSSNGKFTFRPLPMTNGTGELSITITKINLPVNGCYVKDQSIDLQTSLNIESMKLVVDANSQIASLPGIISVNTSYSVPAMNVRAVSGSIEYTFDGNGLDIAPIDLTDIPDFLAGENTNIVLPNPQIYLSVNNPMANLGWDYVSGFRLTAVRENGNRKNFELDYGQIGVGHDKPLEGRYEFRLSPDLRPDQIYLPQGYDNPEFELFSTLGEVISGDGLPEKIEIDLVNPHLLRKEVTKFLLNTKFDSLEGNWEFLAPLALSSDGDNKSQIIYTHTADGWSSEDLDAVTIQTLELTMKVDNDLPLEATLTGYPIDINGRQIGNVTVEGAVVPANAKDQDVKLYITGEVKKFDGITFSAVVYPTSDQVLSPSQTLTLKNVRAKVSGNYVKEL